MSHLSNYQCANFVQINKMQKILKKLDIILVFRLIMSGVLLVVGYQNSDQVAMLFASFFVIYSIVAAKYKIGCGYNNCGFTPEPVIKTNSEEISFTEIK